MKVKPFKNIFFMAAELSQSACLLVLLCLILNLPRAKNESLVADGSQTFGIALVFMAVILEYICVVGQIGFTITGLYTIWKQRKAQNAQAQLAKKKLSENKKVRFDWYVRYVVHSPPTVLLIASVAVQQQPPAQPRKLANDVNANINKNRRRLRYSARPLQQG